MTKDPSALDAALKDLTEAALNLERIATLATGPTLTAADAELAETSAETARQRIQAAGRHGRRGREDAEKAVGICRWRLLKWLPRIKDLLVVELPAPGEREPAPRSGLLAHRFTVFQALLHSGLVAAADAKIMRESLAHGIAHSAVFYHRWLAKVLELSDPVDIRAVSFDQMRMEILLWLLEELGAIKEAENVRTHARITARAAVKRAQGVMEEYVRQRGPTQRFDVAIVVSQVEELVLLTERVLGHARAEDETWRFGEASRDLVRALIHTCGKLVLATFRDIEERHSAGLLTRSGLRGSLKQIESVRHLVQRVRVGGSYVVRQAVERTIARKSTLLADLLTVAAGQKREKADLDLLAEMRDFLVSLEGQA